MCLWKQEFSGTIQVPDFWTPDADGRSVGKFPILPHLHLNQAASSWTDGWFGSGGRYLLSNFSFPFFRFPLCLNPRGRMPHHSSQWPSCYAAPICHIYAGAVQDFSSLQYRRVSLILGQIRVSLIPATQPPFHELLIVDCNVGRT